MNEPLTITCCCKDERCGMTLTVLPILQYFKLTMTPRKDDPKREDAVEWIQPDKFIRRMERDGCKIFGVLLVRHYLDDDLDLDMQITEADRLRLLAMARGEHGEDNKEGEAQPSGLEHAGPRPA